ncbi:tRNA pseudouridine38-40 synthase [Desulfosarcina sp. BuS5]|uniref:tRNA pseudouridine(38-40) synthase TruA n=1 Tax=Desulfosarcina sp. BuS5 TaxID=933262 RepID=UPI00055355B9|nr:tRNA pseudouridine(38-40) synthase TruA [Desulfosarcina sp. BuS5]WDN90509.1 tRNA pseudouridine38-40 synthase [Desulfosarcina sp. BuS5]
MLKNFKIIIEYDGIAYHGWQRQKNCRTIQGEIEKALLRMTGDRIAITGSGRTDAGVHAMGQVANFLCDKNIEPENFRKGLDSILSRDIIIKDCLIVDSKFHARYNVTSKIYNYRILNRKIPSAIDRNYSWFIQKKLNESAMQSAILHILGRHDFQAFEGAGSPRSDSIRTVLKAGLAKRENGYLKFRIEGDGFLRFMVRNIVGTLVDVGLEKITPGDFKKIFLSKDRNLAGATAPPHGLFLMEVKYRFPHN